MYTPHTDVTLLTAVKFINELKDCLRTDRFRTHLYICSTPLHYVLHRTPSYEECGCRVTKNSDCKIQHKAPVFKNCVLLHRFSSVISTCFTNSQKAMYLNQSVLNQYYYGNNHTISDALGMWTRNFPMALPVISANHNIPRALNQHLTVTCPMHLSSRFPNIQLDAILPLPHLPRDCFSKDVSH